MIAEERVKILLIDNDQAISAALAQLLARENLIVLQAAPGREGEEMLKAHLDVGVIVSDLNLPQMDGVRFLEQAKHLAPLAVRVILTGQTNLPATIEAINRGGASLFLAKPWDEEQLRCNLREAARTFLMRRENTRLVATVRRQNEELSLWNQRLAEQVQEQTMRIQQQTDLLKARSDSLQKATDEFHGILNGIPDALLHLSGDLEIRWANTGAARRLGRSVDELVGQRCSRFVAGGDQPCGHCPAVRALVSGQIEDARITGTDGRSWGVKVFPLKDRSGKVTGLIEWASDITERLLLRAEAKQASQLAALGEMAAGVAHEINNPAAVLRFNLPLLQAAFAEAQPLLDEIWQARGEFSLASIPYSEMRDEMPLLLGDCFDSASRIGRIVEDIKDFLRSEKDVFAERVSLNEVATAAQRLVGKALGRPVDWFRAELDPQLPAVHGSFYRLEQVIVNLVRNACQAMVDGEGNVALMSRFDRERGLSILEVHDTGKGIPPEILPRICEPFFTTRREGGGTGLGLSVSSRIVREHGGRLEFTPRAGGGTVAAVLLPCCPEETAHA